MITAMKDWPIKLRRSFLAGLLVVVPLAASLWVLWSVVAWLTNWLPDQARTPLHRVGALIVLVALTTAIGWVTRLMIGRRLVNLGEELIARVPVLNRTYNFMKEISHTLLSGRKTVFQRVVLIEFPKPGTYALGFVTSETGGEAQSKTQSQLIHVFVPTTPNPTSGFLLLVPREKVIPLQMSVTDGMKMVVSGGSVVPSWPLQNQTNHGQ
ncbi:MAG: DUF502 domain-containing protein [Verrucomicrobiae bacterium]|nr:DUF502 domain-containing protein [Verrucomicrobiae bacterium]